MRGQGSRRHPGQHVISSATAYSILSQRVLSAVCSYRRLYRFARTGARCVDPSGRDENRTLGAAHRENCPCFERGYHQFAREGQDRRPHYRARQKRQYHQQLRERRSVSYCWSLASPRRVGAILLLWECSVVSLECSVVAGACGRGIFWDVFQ